MTGLSEPRRSAQSVRHRLPENRPLFLGRHPAEITQIDLVMLPRHAYAQGREDLMMHPGQHLGLAVETADVKGLYAAAFRE